MDIGLQGDGEAGNTGERLQARRLRYKNNAGKPVFIRLFRQNCVSMNLLMHSDRIGNCLYYGALFDPPPKENTP